jgi:predicted RNA binding protein YcfA (HicA-like mRNA interferase family)
MCVHISANMVKVREMIEMLERDGWYQVGVKGSHRQFKHNRKPGKVTVSGGASEDVRKGTLNGILKQARLR